MTKLHEKVALFYSLRPAAPQRIRQCKRSVFAQSSRKMGYDERVLEVVFANDDLGVRLGMPSRAQEIYHEPFLLSTRFRTPFLQRCGVRRIDAVATRC
jgi:hypothetical protein